MGGDPVKASDMKAYYERKEREASWSRVTRAEEVFIQTRMRDEFNPAVMKLPREACDSPLSPHSRGIIYAEDFTGSMSNFLLSLIKEEFPRLITQTYESVPFDPHIMFMGVGDVEAGDKAPLQVTQFETDLRMLDQLQKLWLEQGGGSNPYESYILPWYFAAKHTRMDCFEKRGEKGFLFTFGDEEPTPHLTSEQIKHVFGGRDSLQGSNRISAKECLEMASEKFYCYHIILHGNGYYYNNHEVISKWRKLMRTHVCDLSNHHYLPELVTTIFKMYNGLSKTEALNSIQGNAARNVVKEALEWHEENISDVSTSNDDTKVEYEVF